MDNRPVTEASSIAIGSRCIDKFLSSERPTMLLRTGESTFAVLLTFESDEEAAELAKHEGIPLTGVWG